MSASAAEGLPRVSRNPGCVTQAAMVVEGVREPDFFLQVTGTPFEGEYGQRVSARRRASKFEENVHGNNAALMRHALGPLYGFDADAAWVRNFLDEAPGSSQGLRAMRLWKTRKIFEDLAAGRDVPDVLIRPQLRLPIREGWDEYVSPEFLVMDRATGMYVTGQLKPFVMRDNVADPADLDRARRQSASHIVALEAETRRIVGRVDARERAVFVFASVAGLRPSEPREEELHAEVAATLRAIDTLQFAADEMARLRLDADEPLAMLVDELPYTYQDSCMGSCILASHCSQDHAGTARGLGDSASRALGATTTPHTIVEALLRARAGVDELDPVRSAAAARYVDAAASLGLTAEQLARRLA